MTTDNHDQALEARARELLDRMQKAKGNERGHWCDARAAVDAACDILPKIIAALREGQKAGSQEAVGHLHSNGEFCADRSVVSQSWPVPLYTTPQPPPGYALVPVEPTDNMLDAGHDALDEVHRSKCGSYGECGGTGWGEAGAAYRAMIAAAGAAGGES